MSENVDRINVLGYNIGGNAEEFEELRVRLDIDHALPIWNKAKDSISHRLVT